VSRAASRANMAGNAVKPGIRPYLVHLYLFSANKRPATDRRETARELDQSLSSFSSTSCLLLEIG